MLSLFVANLWVGQSCEALLGEFVDALGADASEPTAEELLDALGDVRPIDLIKVLERAASCGRDALCRGDDVSGRMGVVADVFVASCGAMTFRFSGSGVLVSPLVLPLFNNLGFSAGWRCSHSNEVARSTF